MRRPGKLIPAYFAGIVILLLVACGRLVEDTAVIKIDLKKDGDSATVETFDDGTLIDVTSVTGIGGLTATLNQAQWPDSIITRLRLRGLEFLEIRYGDVVITTAVPSSGDHSAELMLTVQHPDGKIESASPSYDIYYPVIRHGRDERGQFFEVGLPAHFFQAAYPDFAMQWIDFYR